MTRCERLVRAALRRTLRAAFSRWMEVREETARLNRKLRVAVAKFTRRDVYNAFAAWCESLRIGTRERQSALRVFSEGAIQLARSRRRVLHVVAVRGGGARSKPKPGQAIHPRVDQSRVLVRVHPLARRRPRAQTRTSDPVQLVGARARARRHLGVPRVARTRARRVPRARARAPSGASHARPPPRLRLSRVARGGGGDARVVDARPRLGKVPRRDSARDDVPRVWRLARDDYREQDERTRGSSRASSRAPSHPGARVRRVDRGDGGVSSSSRRRRAERTIPPRGDASRPERGVPPLGRIRGGACRGAAQALRRALAFLSPRVAPRVRRMDGSRRGRETTARVAREGFGSMERRGDAIGVVVVEERDPRRPSSARRRASFRGGRDEPSRRGGGGSFPRRRRSAIPRDVPSVDAFRRGASRASRRRVERFARLRQGGHVLGVPPLARTRGEAPPREGGARANPRAMGTARVARRVFHVDVVRVDATPTTRRRDASIRRQEGDASRGDVRGVERRARGS